MRPAFFLLSSWHNQTRTQQHNLMNSKAKFLMESNNTKIIHHNQVILIPGMQGRFNIQKLIRKSYQQNDEEKALGKTIISSW